MGVEEGAESGDVAFARLPHPAMFAMILVMSSVLRWALRGPWSRRR
jgi:hypothetical protein